MVSGIEGLKRCRQLRELVWFLMPGYYILRYKERFNRPTKIKSTIEYMEANRKSPNMVQHLIAETEQREAERRMDKNVTAVREVWQHDTAPGKSIYLDYPSRGG